MTTPKEFSKGALMLPEQKADFWKKKKTIDAVKIDDVNITISCTVDTSLTSSFMYLLSLSFVNLKFLVSLTLLPGGMQSDRSFHPNHALFTSVSKIHAMISQKICLHWLAKKFTLYNVIIITLIAHTYLKIKTKSRIYVLQTS